MGSQVEFSHTCPAPAADTPLLPPTVLEAAETMAKREKPAAEVIVAADEAEIQQCIQVRIDVFHHEQKFPLETEVDEYDEPGRAVHFLLRSTPDHRPMGTLRLIEKPGEYKLGRLCILKEYRGLHFGEDLVRNAHSWVIVQAKRTGRPAEISLHSQIHAKSFYSRHRLFLTQRLITPAPFPIFPNPAYNPYPVGASIQSRIAAKVTCKKDPRVSEIRIVCTVMVQLHLAFDDLLMRLRKLSSAANDTLIKLRHTDPDPGSHLPLSSLRASQPPYSDRPSNEIHSCPRSLTCTTLDSHSHGTGGIRGSRIWSATSSLDACTPIFPPDLAMKSYSLLLPAWDVHCALGSSLARTFCFAVGAGAGSSLLMALRRPSSPPMTTLATKRLGLHACSQTLRCPRLPEHSDLNTFPKHTGVHCPNAPIHTLKRSGARPHSRPGIPPLTDIAEFDEDGAPHQRMIWRAPNTPDTGTIDPGAN